MLAVILGGVFGWAQDVGFWRPLRKRGTGLIALMIISIGVSLLLRYFYLYVFAGERRSYTQYVIQGSIDLGPFDYAPRDLWIMGISLIVLALVAVALVRTRIGKATRACPTTRRSRRRPASTSTGWSPRYGSLAPRSLPWRA